MQKLIVLICILASSQAAFGQFSSKAKPQPTETRQQPQLQLSEFRSVGNTPYLVASITLRESRESSSKFGSSSPVSSSRWNSKVNYVFFDTQNDSAVALLPTNNALIISREECSESITSEDDLKPAVELASAKQPPSNRSTPTVVWNLVEYVAKDTDGDGEITTKDRHALGVADAGGRGFVEVIPNLGGIFSKKMLDANTLLVIHGSQDKQVAVRVDLSQRKIVSSKPLPNFGTQ